MVASKDKNKSTSAPRKITQSQALLIFSTVIYGIVLVSNFYIHKHLSGPLYVGEGLVADFFADRQERTLGANNGESLKPTYPFGELYDGNAITSILLEQKEPPNDIERLRFQPGTLDLTSQQTLPYCYSDPTIYKQHFPQSLRQVTSISDTHMLIYLMLPKSASSTARWMMDNVLNASDHPLSGLGHELNPGGDYEDYTTLTFVRDPLARFYSSYDEVFLRFGPWMQKRKGNFFKRYNDFKHPFPYLYANMTDWDDYQNAFCPKSLGWGKKRCSKIKTMENGTLATRFERFVWDYDGISPFDLVCASRVCFGIFSFIFHSISSSFTAASSLAGATSFKQTYWKAQTNSETMCAE